MGGQLGPATARAFAGLDFNDGWVLDIGAGTGLSTAAVLRILPNARVMAIEPDPAMGAVLMTRVVADDLMRRQVSIIPAGLSEADIPNRFDAVAMISTLHNFVPEDRQRFWQLFSDRLSPVNRAVIEIQLPTNERIPPTRMQRAQIGDIKYEGWMGASPAAEVVAKLNAFDLVVTVALGSTLATVLLSKDVAFLEGALAFAMLAVVQWIVSRLSIASSGFRRIIRSDPRLLVEHGDYPPEAMRQERTTADEIDSAIRASGFGRMEDIGAVVLETDGSLSVIDINDRPLTTINNEKR